MWQFRIFGTLYEDPEKWCEKMRKFLKEQNVTVVSFELRHVTNDGDTYYHCTSSGLRKKY